MTKTFQTPMMKQYSKIKGEYPDCILFFRLGDFYEMFLDDAKIASKIMGLTLTSRNKGKDGKIPMCGIPYHAVDTYVPKLIDAGHKIAICEQVGDVTNGKSIVDRAVVKIITRGTITDESLLDRKSNSYILTLNTTLKKNHDASFAYADFSTGEFYVKTIDAGENPQRSIQNFLSQVSPEEIILTDEQYNNPKILNLVRINNKVNITKYGGFQKPRKKNKNLKDVENLINKFFNVYSIEALDFDYDNYDLLNAIGLLISFFNYTQKQNVYHFKNIKDLTHKAFMEIDANTIANLEIFESNQIRSQTQQKELSLFEVLDKTSTAMGSRMLKRNLIFPLLDKQKIEERLDIVEEIIKNHKLMSDITSHLTKIADIQRLIGKIGVGSANARDALSLADSLLHAIEIYKLTKPNDVFAPVFTNVDEETITNIEALIIKIKDTLKTDPPVLTKTGRMIKDGINQELDDLKESIKESQEWIANLETTERERTGINKLKVGFNSVFGYYIEVSKLHIDKVPNNYIRKQTLVSSERYITDELKYKEEIVLNAQEKINELEYKIFLELLNDIKQGFLYIQNIANLVASIDYLKSFALKAIESNYTKPKINDMSTFDTVIKNGRHPVVEFVLETGTFTPNDTNLSKSHSFHLITGPNMAGKSTYIRQIAIIQLMAQIGSYIPGDMAEISIVDAIHTRIGAGDALAQGLSTFMVEMIETAKILRNATKHSLIILDEVGRGTGTLDGLSIAAAIIEYIHDTIGAKTLFATHFHELINLEQKFKKLSNFHIEIREENNNIQFLHKVERGGTDKSYGIEVAKMAGIPEKVIKRANELMRRESQTQLSLGF